MGGDKRGLDKSTVKIKGDKKIMEKKTYNKLKKMYDGLKAINENSAKLPHVTRFAIDFACLLATRDALKEWDTENNRHENFLELLTSLLAEAQYNCAEIIAKQEGIEK
jgi:hypothetical protein